MPKVTLYCRECSYKARRELQAECGSRGIRETSSELGICPKGHGLLYREDGLEQERWADWAKGFDVLRNVVGKLLPVRIKIPQHIKVALRNRR